MIVLARADDRLENAVGFGTAAFEVGRVDQAPSGSRLQRGFEHVRFGAVDDQRQPDHRSHGLDEMDHGGDFVRAQNLATNNYLDLSNKSNAAHVHGWQDQSGHPENLPHQQWTAHEVELIGSELSSTGARHTTLAAFRLGAVEPSRMG